MRDRAFGLTFVDRLILRLVFVCPHRKLPAMRGLLLVITLIAASLGIGHAQRLGGVRKPGGLAVAFFNHERLRHPAGQKALRDFEFFFLQIHEIVKRDFPNVELRILAPGELLQLPDGTNLNVQNMRQEIGYVLSASGRKTRILTGVQTDADFACAAAKYFQRRSAACPK